MSQPPLIPAALYGLRTWRLVEDEGGERLAATQRPVRWPCGGVWLTAACGGREPGEHVAPDPACNCGIHAWHPRRASARRVLASHFEIPGVVEAVGAAEVHEDGFRAARARPYALILLPGRNERLVGRLARRHGAHIVRVDGPDALLAWCRDRGLGLDERTVEDLLGPEEAARRRRARRRRMRRDVARAVGAVGLATALLAGGTRVFTDSPGPHERFGRSGWVRTP